MNIEKTSAQFHDESKIIKNGVCLDKPSNIYKFDHIFSSSTSNQHIYDFIKNKDKINLIKEQTTTVIFAGLSASGKNKILCGQKGELGVMQMLVEDLIDLFDKQPIKLGIFSSTFKKFSFNDLLKTKNIEPFSQDLFSSEELSNSKKIIETLFRELKVFKKTISESKIEGFFVMRFCSTLFSNNFVQFIYLDTSSSTEYCRLIDYFTQKTSLSNSLYPLNKNHNIKIIHTVPSLMENVKESNKIFSHFSCLHAGRIDLIQKKYPEFSFNTLNQNQLNDILGEGQEKNGSTIQTENKVLDNKIISHSTNECSVGEKKDNNSIDAKEENLVHFLSGNKVEGDFLEGDDKNCIDNDHLDCIYFDSEIKKLLSCLELISKVSTNGKKDEITDQSKKIFETLGAIHKKFIASLNQKNEVISTLQIENTVHKQSLASSLDKETIFKEIINSNESKLIDISKKLQKKREKLKLLKELNGNYVLELGLKNKEIQNLVKNLQSQVTSISKESIVEKINENSNISPNFDTRSSQSFLNSSMNILKERNSISSAGNLSLCSNEKLSTSELRAQNRSKKFVNLVDKDINWFKKNYCILLNDKVLLEKEIKHKDAMLSKIKHESHLRKVQSELSKLSEQKEEKSVICSEQVEKDMLSLKMEKNNLLEKYEQSLRFVENFRNNESKFDELLKTQKKKTKKYKELANELQLTCDKLQSLQIKLQEKLQLYVDNNIKLKSSNEKMKSQLKEAQGKYMAEIHDLEEKAENFLTSAKLLGEKNHQQKTDLKFIYETSEKLENAIEFFRTKYVNKKNDVKKLKNEIWELQKLLENSQDKKATQKGKHHSELEQGNLKIIHKK